MALKAAGRQSLVDTVVGALREQLDAGEWPVGARIPTEHALAAELGVGRNTVREAVRVLVHAGQLESRQGNGTFVVSATDPGAVVRDVQRAGIRDVLEVRIALETEAARLAATRHTADDLARMRTALDAQAAHEQSGHELHAEHDIAFHTAVVEAAHNAALAATYRWFSGSVHDALVAALRDADMPPIVQHDHQVVLDAIASGDPDAAEQAARDLLTTPMRTVEQLLA